MVSRNAIAKLEHFKDNFFHDVPAPVIFNQFGNVFKLGFQYITKANGTIVIMRFQVDNEPLFNIDMNGNLSLFYTKFNINQFRTIQEYVQMIQSANLSTIAKEIDDSKK